MSLTRWTEPPRDGGATASTPPRSTVMPKPDAVAILGVSMTHAERTRTAMLCALLFLVALVFVVGRTARDALFLTKFPVSWIGPMWMAYGAASSLVALGYARYAARLPRVRFVVTFAAVAAASFVVLRVLIGQEIRAAYAVLYVVAEIIANLAAMAAWTLAQDLHDPRSAKRLFGLIGAGRVAGVVVCGFATGAVVRTLGTENLLLVLAFAMLGFAALTVAIGRRFALPGPAQATPGEIPETALRSLTSPYVGSIALMMLALFAILTVGDYQFKAIAQTAYPRRDELASFMANFYGVLGAFGIFVQLVVTPRLLQRYGVLAGMLAMPLAFATSTVGLLLAPGIVLATLLKGSDNGLQFTVHEATMQLLLFPFPVAARSRVRTVVDAVFKPIGCGVGALLLLAFAPSAAASAPGPALVARAAHLGFYTLPLGLAVIALVPIVRRGYVACMRQTLVRRELEPEVVAQSPHTRAMLGAALRGADAPQVIFAVAELRGADDAAITDALPALVCHRSRRVRALALRTACELGDPRTAELARAAFDDPRGPVRVAAVEAFAMCLREDAHDELLALADRPDDEPVRTAAVAALVRSCGLDGMLDGAPRLRALLESTQAEERVAAARVLGMVGEASLQRALSRLLADPVPEVRRAAVDAASKVGDVRLLPQLLEALAERALAPGASRALVALGPDAIPALAARLTSPLPPREARLAIPRILAGIGTPDALAALLARLDDADDLVRQKILASASRLRLALAAPALPLARIRAHIDAEIAEHVEVREAYISVRPLVRTRLLDEDLVRRLRKSIVRILRLCELAYPRAVVASVRTHVFGSDVSLRANAFEVLESLLDRHLRERLVELVERVLTLRSGHFPAPSLSPREAYAATWLSGEIARGEPWSAAIALEAIAHRGLAAGAPHALAALVHPDPLIREAAAMAVVATRPAGYERALERLRGDPDPALQSVVRAWDQSGRAGGPGLGAAGGPIVIKPLAELMYSTIEKILFLQRVPVFSRVAGEDLVFLARGSAVVSVRKGEVVFRQGDAGGAMYLIIQGRIALTVDGRAVAELGENDVFGEMSIFDQEPRASTATVTEDAELLRVSAQDFHEAVRETVEIAEAVIQVLNRRLRETDRRLAAATGGSESPVSVAVARAAAEEPEIAARAADELDLD